MLAAKTSTAWSESQIAVSYFSLGILLALLVAILLPKSWMLHAPIPDEDAIAERIRPAADLELAPPAVTAVRGKRTGAVLVQEYCRSCHSKGLGGAPKIGDRKAWAPRLNQGLNVLVHSVISGKCTLSPRGGADATEMELARAIVHMVWPRMRL